MGRAVAQGRVAAVKVEVDVKVAGRFQAGFFERGEGGTGGQQLGFERIPAGFGLGVVVGVARLAKAGHGLGPVDAGTAGGAGVLAATVGLDNQGWRSVRAYSRATSTSSAGICLVRCPPTKRREQASRQVAREHQRPPIRGR